MKRFCPHCMDEFEQPEGGCPKCGGELVTLPDETLVGQVLDDRYTILGIVGRGGMGVVYRARQKYLDREVAVKVLRRDMSADAANVKRFLLEARAASALRNPHTVTIHDFGITKDGQLYFVMEMLEGLPLSRIIRKGPMQPDRVARLVTQAAASLAEAHSKGIWHRDIKPENLLVVQADNGAETLKVLDFGIARLANSGTHLTVLGMVCGTPQYVSPEQAQGKPLDHRTDVYSLAVVTYEMLAGKPPFEGETPVQVLVAHVKSTPPPLDEATADAVVSKAVWRVVRWALEKAPESRPGSAELFATSLRQAVADPDYAPPTDADAETRRAVPAPGKPGPITPQATAPTAYPEQESPEASRRSDGERGEDRSRPGRTAPTAYPEQESPEASLRSDGLHVADGTAMYGAQGAGGPASSEVEVADSGIGAKLAGRSATPEPSVRGVSDVSAPGPAWSDVSVSSDEILPHGRRIRIAWAAGIGIGVLLLGLLLVLLLVFRPWQGAIPELTGPDPAALRERADAAAGAVGPVSADVGTAAIPADVSAPGNLGEAGSAPSPDPRLPTPSSEAPEVVAQPGAEVALLAETRDSATVPDVVAPSDPPDVHGAGDPGPRPVDASVSSPADASGTGKGTGKGESGTGMGTGKGESGTGKGTGKGESGTGKGTDSGEYFLIGPGGKESGTGTGKDGGTGEEYIRME